MLRVEERSPSPSVSISQQSAAESKSPEGEPEHVFIFFWFTSGPIAYSLYSVDAPPVPSVINSVPYSSKPESSSSCDHHHQVLSKSDNTRTIYPILEFPSGDYADWMCCVELGSKVYFLGGVPHGNQSGPLPRDVFVLDARAACTSNHCSSDKELLKKGTPMNTGKPYPYVFAALGRIFVISARLQYNNWKDEQLSWFEVYDPDTNRWVIMPNPPVDVWVEGHAVLDRKVFLVGTDSRVLYFNLDNSVWVSFPKYGSLSRSAYCGRGEFVEDTLYACYNRTIVAFGGANYSQSDQGHHDDKPEGLFYHKAFLPPEMVDAIYGDEYYSTDRSPYLVPFGNRTFCHVLASSLPDPSNPIYLEDSERFHIRLTVFEALKDTYTESFYGAETTYFRANVLRSADYVATSRCGAIVPGLLQGCFSVSFGAGMIQ